jgi:hypothetical protein
MLNINEKSSLGTSLNWAENELDLKLVPLNEIKLRFYRYCYFG